MNLSAEISTATVRYCNFRNKSGGPYSIENQLNTYFIENLYSADLIQKNIRLTKEDNFDVQRL